MAKVNLVIDQDKKNLKDAYNQAMTDLQAILDGTATDFNEVNWALDKLGC